MITREMFRQLANQLTVCIPDQAAAVQVQPRDDAAGPRWAGSGAIFVYINGVPHRATMTVRITPENARNWPEK